MSRYILPNYGFEYEISERTLPAPARALEERFATLLRLVPGWRDAEVFNGGTADELLPWGWSARAAEVSACGPDVAVVKRVNSKCFSHEVERELGVVLEGAMVARSIEEVRAAATRLNGPWLVKHPFGVAGRDQVRGSGWDETVEHRIAKMLAETEVLLEPCLPILEEFSVHVDCVDLDPQIVSVAGLRTDRFGTFRGNITGVRVPPVVVDQARDAARLAMDAGYRGPLGIDGFRTPDRIRAISEMNARWTFGRLAIELGASLGHDVVWHHGPTTHRPSDLQPVTFGANRGAWLLPEWCDPAGVSGTWIEFVDTAS